MIARLDGAMNVDYLQKMLDYLRYLEIRAKSKATQPQIDQLAKEVKQDWWEKSRDRFVK